LSYQKNIVILLIYYQSTLLRHYIILGFSCHIQRRGTIGEPTVTHFGIG